MNSSNGSVPSWFGNPKNDALYLNAWRESPLSYIPGQAIDTQWTADHYEVLLGTDPTGHLFQRASKILLRNRFYPAEVMVNTSDYQLADRTVQPGDCVLQRIRILNLGGLPVLDTLTLNQITYLCDEPRRKGFTYTTTTVHSEVGEWSPVVEWRDTGQVVLVIDVLSRVKPGSSRLVQRITRQLQLRAHRLGINNFRNLLSGEPHSLAKPETLVPAEFLPVGMLGLALVLFALAWRSFSRRDR